MFDLNKLTPDARAYFDALPPLQQITLIHSGLGYTTRRELEGFVEEQGDH